MKRTVKSFLVLALTACAFSSNAQLVINVGDHALSPGAIQAFDLFVQNTSSSPVDVFGLNFYVQIADGFDQTPAPVLLGPDIVTDTIFKDNNNGQIYPPDSIATLHVRAATTATSESNPNPVTLAPNSSGKLARVLVDTSGYTGGTWGLFVGTTRAGNTSFVDVNLDALFPTITEGTISVVPEPNAALAVAGLLLGAAALRRYRAGVRNA